MEGMQISYIVLLENRLRVFIHPRFINTFMPALIVALAMPVSSIILSYEGKARSVCEFVLYRKYINRLTAAGVRLHISLMNE